jgi:hypothetical protein
MNTNPSLQCLIFSSCGCEEGWSALGENLKNNSRHAINHLELSHLPLKDKGISALAVAFEAKWTHSLSILRLHETQLGAKGGETKREKERTEDNDNSKKLPPSPPFSDNVDQSIGIESSGIIWIGGIESLKQQSRSSGWSCIGTLDHRHGAERGRCSTTVSITKVNFHSFPNPSSIR